ncbi:hypothetical protein ACNKHQ_17720 [Shigella flexneri]
MAAMSGLAAAELAEVYDETALMRPPAAIPPPGDDTVHGRRRWSERSLPAATGLAER